MPDHCEQKLTLTLRKTVPISFLETAGDAAEAPELICRCKFFPVKNVVLSAAALDTEAAAQTESIIKQLTSNN